MGIKRPLDAEEFPEPSISLPKPLDYNKRLNLNVEESHINTPKADFHGGPKNVLCESHDNEPLEQNEPDTGYAADKELEASLPLSHITSSSSEEEEDSGEGPIFLWPYFPENDLSIPRRPFEQFQDPYVSQLNEPPRKEIPIGPDHQAEIPAWDPQASRRDYLASQNEHDLKMLGTLITPMPDSTKDGPKPGSGRADCTCPDMGSMRCVQQHVKEAREKLLDLVGPENFNKLGLDEMGEEVARRWAQDEEEAFHEIVLSNPTVFWEHLKAEFPARTMSEIVSYYFNVFMLLRRAAQNRSPVLEIDSDDDEEWEDLDSVYPGDDNEEALGQNGDFFIDPGVEDGDEEEEEEDLGAGWVDGSRAEPGKVDGDSKAGKQENGAAADIKVEKKDGGGNEGAVEEASADKVSNVPGFLNQ